LKRKVPLATAGVPVWPVMRHQRTVLALEDVFSRPSPRIPPHRPRGSWTGWGSVW
jgi:hypothetical protein